MEKTKPQTGHLDGNLKASSDLTDCELVDTDVEKSLLKADSTVVPQEVRLRAAARSTENNPEENIGSKQKRKRENPIDKAKNEDEIQNMDRVNVNVNEDEIQIGMGSTESIAEVNVNVNGKRKRKRKRKRCGRISSEIKIMNQVAGSKSSTEGNHEGTGGKATENECPPNDSEISVRTQLSVLPHDKVSDEIVINEGQCSAEGGSIISTYNVEGTSHLSNPCVNEAEYFSKDLGYYTGITSIPSFKRKLIVLDVNGLLANIVMPAPKDYRADGHILGRAIFKRPFCDDFLRFCFQNFAVGVWSSRSKKIIERVVDFLLGDQKDKLLFCWDMSHSTQTGFNTLENVYKPLVFKELKKIWENDDPSLPWKNGDYNESNTLLLDDSPYKALLNPLHTAIFPHSYHYKDSNDNSLGPGGDLRVYLEGLLQSENVQKYVEQHPFGQSAINETNMSWAFYSGVLESTSKQLQDIHSQFPTNTE